MKQHISLSGQFRVVKKSADNQVLFDSGVLNNLLLDTGLDFFGGDTGEVSIFKYLAVGTGNSQPIETQNRLDSAVAITLASGNEYNDDYNQDRDGDFYTVSRTHKYRFSGLRNVNICELGLVNSTDISKHIAYTRALIKDDKNNPLVITVLEGEVLEVYYTLNQIFQLKEIQKTLALSDGRGGIRGNIHCKMRLFNIGKITFETKRYGNHVGEQLTRGGSTQLARAYSSQELGSFEGQPTGSSSSISSPSQMIFSKYEPLSRKKNVTLIIESNLNLPNLGALVIGTSMGYYQISFVNEDGSAINKDNSRTFGVTLEISWGRDQRN